MLEQLPPLKDWDTTRNTMHAYAKVIGAVPRALAQPHPQWWHVSLKPAGNGLQTDAFTLKDGRDMQLLMDFERHVLVLSVDGKVSLETSSQDGLSASELAVLIEGHLASQGVAVQLDRTKVEEGSVEGYDPTLAESYFSALTSIAKVLEEMREMLGEATGIVNFWPHNFDLAFEWFSEKSIVVEANGESSEAPAQINFGFAPGDSTYARPYFYSNPWPFDKTLMGHDLPSGAQWFLDRWQGSLLSYDSLVGEPEYAARLKEYYSAIYRIASPGLMK